MSFEMEPVAEPCPDCGSIKHRSCGIGAYAVHRCTDCNRYVGPNHEGVPCKKAAK